MLPNAKEFISTVLSETEPPAIRQIIADDQIQCEVIKNMASWAPVSKESDANDSGNIRTWLSLVTKWCCLNDWQPLKTTDLSQFIKHGVFFCDEIAIAKNGESPKGSYGVILKIEDETVYIKRGKLVIKYSGEKVSKYLWFYKMTETERNAAFYRKFTKI